MFYWDFQVALVVKNLPANAGDIKDLGSIPGLGRFLLEEEMATGSSILACEIPWAEEAGGLQSMGWKRAGHYWSTNTFTFTLSCSTDQLISNHVNPEMM